ncbi:MAG: ornithine cyclodeaminase family protein [Desulfobacteraceae bacterium]|nr:ornithine cyclodeaminase family protein [Desulfobacteraceae bacterium]
MKIRILTAGDVRTALPMVRAIEAMRAAYGQFSSGHATVPLRSRLHTENGVTLLMPAHLHDTADLAVKIVSVYGDNPGKGLPAVSAMVVVLDPETGRPLALMDGDSLTALRTGAGGGLAAELLARRDAKIVTLFGAGVQGRAQLAAVLAVRDIERVVVMDKSAAAAGALAAEIQSQQDSLQVEINLPVERAVRNADIILAATTTMTPLFDGGLVSPGTHITAVGSYTPEMQEIDAAVVQRAKVVVDSREACRAETGDIIRSDADIHAELGEIVNGRAAGRENDAEITFFKSVGLAAQDAAAAAAVLAEAKTQGLGTEFQMA